MATLLTSRPAHWASCDSQIRHASADYSTGWPQRTRSNGAVWPSELLRRHATSRSARNSRSTGSVKDGPEPLSRRADPRPEL
jgi:hypothetical protein